MKPVLLLGVLLLPLPPAIAPASQGEARLVLEALDGTTRTVDPAGFRTDDPRREGAWLVRVEGLEAPTAPARDGGAGGAGERGPEATITLANGDLLRGRIVGGVGEDLRLELFAGVELALGIDRIQGLVLEGNLPETLAAPLEPAPEGDRLYRRTGATLDRDDGAVAAFSTDGVTFESTLLGPRLVPWGELAALFVEGLGGGDADADPTGGVAGAVDLANGGRVRGRLRGLDAEGCRLSLGGEEGITLPLAQVLQVAVDDGALAFLSDLPVLREEGRGDPFGDGLGMVFPYRIDRAAAGQQPLQAGGRHYARGIGTHAPTRVTWVLAPGWRTLRGLVAVDDSVLRNEARGSVIFRIRVDGEVRWESDVLRGGDHPVRIPALDLGEASAPRELTLEADMVEEMDAGGDRADWLRMILVRG